MKGCVVITSHVVFIYLKIVKTLTRCCWSIPRREVWAKGKGRYTFNTGGYCPIELSCPHQSSFLRLDFFLIPCVTCNRLLRRFTTLLLYLEHGVLTLDKLKSRKGIIWGEWRQYVFSTRYISWATRSRCLTSMGWRYSSCMSTPRFVLRLSWWKPKSSSTRLLLTPSSHSR